jgi:hypothetical protein
MIRVYTASKLTKGAFWRVLHFDTPWIYCHARWLKHNFIGTPDTPEHARKFWIEDEEDIRSADCVVVYAEAGEHLRGALVEAGMALILNIPVYVIGDHPDYGTWRYHPGVIRVGSIEEWLDLMKSIA